MNSCKETLRFIRSVVGDELPVTIRVFGRRRILQSYIGEHARYVPPEKWDATYFAYSPLSDEERTAKAVAKQAQVEQRIRDLEAAGWNAKTSKDFEALFPDEV